MSKKIHDENEIRAFASTHTISECADRYNMERNSMYTWMNQHHINYLHIQKRNNKYVKKISDESFIIAQAFGKLYPTVPIDGWFFVALGVLAYAKIDNDDNYPTKELFSTAVEYMQEKI
jgi:hypothetical protein